MDVRPDAPWDPDPLEIGARVRVRLNGECPGTMPWRGTYKPHFPGYDGRTGEVALLHCPGSECMDGHPYIVLFDGWSISDARFARVELERLKGA